MKTDTIVPPPIKLEIRHSGAIGESGRFTGYTKDKEGKENTQGLRSFAPIKVNRDV